MSECREWIHKDGAYIKPSECKYASLQSQLEAARKEVEDAKRDIRVLDRSHLEYTKTQTKVGDYLRQQIATLNASLAEVKKQRDHARNHTEAFLSELFGRPYTYIEKDALAEQVEMLAALEAERDALKQEATDLVLIVETRNRENAKLREAVEAAEKVITNGLFVHGFRGHDEDGEPREQVHPTAGPENPYVTPEYIASMRADGAFFEYRIEPIQREDAFELLSKLKGALRRAE